MKNKYPKIKKYYVGKSKYGNHKVTVGGVRYDSKKEAQRHYELKLLEKIGEIQDLETQIPFMLLDGIYVIKNGKKSKQQAVKYVADFIYREKGKKIVEDLKSVATEEDKNYRLKRKMLLASDNEFDVFREVINDNWGNIEVVEYKRIK